MHTERPVRAEGAVARGAKCGTLVGDGRAAGEVEMTYEDDEVLRQQKT